MSDLMNRLLHEIDVTNFNSVTLKELNEEYPNLWKELLYYLQNEATYLTHSYIRNSDDYMQSGTSVIRKIDELSDLKDNELDSYINSIKSYLADTDTGLVDGNTNYFWNESVSSLVSYVLLHFNSSVIEEKETASGNYSESDNSVSMRYGAIPTKGQDYRIYDVKNADARRQFTSDPHGRWVRPWYNIDNESYGKVRGTDKILSVLGDSRHLQPTRKDGLNKWIRLIMPKYSRNVEIEDLNRNFWVIAQVITAISAYLFEDESPIYETLIRMNKEIIQLWENTLYLWLAVALISQKPYYTKLHSEIIVVNPNDFFCDVKYDNFTKEISESITLKSLWNNHLNYLRDTYPECNLCIVPKVRLDNYEHNYYAKEMYPGVIMYNRNKENTNEALSYVSFRDNIINCEDYKDSLTSVVDNLTNYKYIIPASNADGYPDTGEYKYHCFIRTEGTISAHFNEATNNIVFGDFELKLYDGGNDVISNVRKLLRTITWGIQGTASMNPITVEPSAAASGTASYGNGYYLGDVVSKGSLSLALGDVSVQTVKMAPIGGSHWGANDKTDAEYVEQNPYWHGGRWDLVTKNGKHTDYNDMVMNLAETNIEILDKYISAIGNNIEDNPSAEQHNTREENQGVQLYIAQRPCDLYLTDDAVEYFINNYWQTGESTYKDTSEKTNMAKKYGTNLAGFYYINGSGNIRHSDTTTYEGDYFEMDLYDSDHPHKNIKRYYLPEGKNVGSVNMKQSLRKGYVVKTSSTNGESLQRFKEVDDTELTTGNAEEYAKIHTELSDINNPKYEEMLDTDGINKTYKITRGTPMVPAAPTWRHMLLRYNQSRQTNYRGAILSIPNGNTRKNYEYSRYHHLFTFIPLENEFAQRYCTNCLTDDLCAKSITYDTKDFTYGRKRFTQDYIYTFVKRGEAMGKDNWFILYVQVNGTFRAFDRYYTLQTIDSEEPETYFNVVQYNTSGFNNLNSLNNQASADPDSGFDISVLDSSGSWEEDNSVPELVGTTKTEKSNYAKQIMKAQYMLDASGDKQKELITKVDGEYYYTDHNHIYRDGFSNVSLSAKDYSGKWADVTTCPQLAIFIATCEYDRAQAIAQEPPAQYTPENWPTNIPLSISDTDDRWSLYKYYLSPSNAAKWLSNNILIDQGENAERRYKVSTGENSLEQKILLCQVISNSSAGGSSNGPLTNYIGMYMRQSKGHEYTIIDTDNKNYINNNVHLYERMKPTITQVRSHIFTANGEYSRYEKDCINDYGEVRGKWKEQCPLSNTKAIWAKYYAAIEDATNSFNSAYVRYDTNNYYYDFFHDPHQGKPEIPIPNKETLG